jgi:uncharacterized protein YcbK (DUF882 family)
MVGALVSLLAASCTSSPDGELQMNTYEGNAAMVAAPVTGEGDAAPSTTHDAAGRPSPRKAVAALPAAKPEAATSQQPSAEPVPAAPSADAPSAEATAATAPAERVEAAPETVAGNQATAVGSAGAPLQLAPAQAAPATKKSLFSSLFSTRRAAAATSQTPAETPDAQPAAQPDDEPDASKPAALASRTTASETKPKAFIENIPAKPVVDLQAKRQPVVMASLGGGGGGDDGFDGLPGVRQSALFEIKRKSGIDDDSDIDLHEEELYGAPVRVASAAGLARLAPNGLLKQTDDVDVTCLKPSLVRVLKQVERRYGKKLIVTSGYRDRARNIRARGAKNSLHMYCAAADIQVPGVGKAELASFLRGMPGRGGVGTYCHTNSVHVDIGPERDWNWRCRRRG